MIINKKKFKFTFFSLSQLITIRRHDGHSAVKSVCERERKKRMYKVFPTLQPVSSRFANFTVQSDAEAFSLQKRLYCACC